MSDVLDWLESNVAFVVLLLAATFIIVLVLRWTGPRHFDWRKRGLVSHEPSRVLEGAGEVTAEAWPDAGHGAATTIVIVIRNTGGVPVRRVGVESSDLAIYEQVPRDLEPGGEFMVRPAREPVPDRFWVVLRWTGPDGLERQCEESLVRPA